MVEKEVLKAFLDNPENFIKVPAEYFIDPLARKCYELFLSFLKPPLSIYPKIGDLISKADKELKLFIIELENIEVDFNIKAKINELYNNYLKYEAIKVVNNLLKEIEKDNNNVEDIIRHKINDFISIVYKDSDEEKGFIYENVKNRWKRFKEILSGKIDEEIIPFGIEKLDYYTNGGLRKGHILCFFAETGGYKTKTKANLAYNFSFLFKKEVMVFTLEVPKLDYELIIDSRHSLIDFAILKNAKLDNDQKDVYKSSLENMLINKPKLYIVDVPGRCDTSVIIKELEEYRLKIGHYPDVVIIDYANELEPISEYYGTSEKYKNLGIELRRIARTYNIAIVTSMQSNREAKRTRDKSKIGIEHISESHYFANVCHLIIHLYQEDTDDSLNILNWAIKKNRYGRSNVSFQTFIAPEYNYIGDKSIKLPF